ncbi:MAG: LptF/LptG family permease [Chitinophagales bacterium]
MKIIDKYILRQFLGTFFFSVLLFSAITVVIDVSEKIDDFIEKKAPFKEIVLDYYLNFVPHIVSLLSPLFIFIAVIFFTSRLSNRSEIIAMTNGGISFYRILFGPYLLGATLLFSLQTIATNYYVPNANKKRIAFELKYFNKSVNNSDKNIHFKIDSTTYVYVNSFNSRDNSGIKFGMEKLNGLTLTYKLIADRVVYNDSTQKWTLYNWFERHIDGLNETIASGKTRDTLLRLLPNDFQKKTIYKDAMTTPELNAFIAEEQMRGGKSIETFQVEKYRRMAIPFATFILTAMGYAIASRKVRGGIGLPLFYGIALSSLFIISLQFSTTFSINANLPPWLGAWIPNIIFGIITIYLIIRSQK